MFTKHQGHKGQHRSKQLLLKPSFKAFITKQSEQLNRSLRYVQLCTSLCSRTQTPRRGAAFSSAQPRPPELPGTTWSFPSVTQHQAGCRSLTLLSPQLLLPACPCQRQRLQRSDPVWICAGSCSPKGRRLQLTWAQGGGTEPPHSRGMRRKLPTHFWMTYLAWKVIRVP